MRSRALFLKNAFVKQRLKINFEKNSEKNYEEQIYEEKF